MKKKITLKHKFVAMNLFLVITPVFVLIIALNPLNYISIHEVNEAFQVLHKLTFESNHSNLEADYQTIKNVIDTASSETYNQMIRICVIVIGVSSVVAILLGFLMSRNISEPVMEAIDLFKELSEGNLPKTMDIQRNDELGEMMFTLYDTFAKQSTIIQLSLLRNLDTPIMIIDNKFNITYVNDSFCKRTSQINSQCVGKKCHELIKTNFCQTNNCMGCKTIEKNQNMDSEIRVSMGETNNIPMMTTYIPIENKGIVEGAICFFVDQSSIYEIIDEIKIVTKNLNESSEVFKNFSQQMSDSAIEISSYSEQSSGNVKQISSNGEDIIANILQESNTIKEMSKALNRITEITKKAKNISLKASEKSLEITGKMKSMANISEEIGKIIIVIDEIADRTDLLALNAAIEAEGAGSAGKGFAVVADEVQKLAKQSSDATNEITRQIANVQKSTKDTQHDIEMIHSTITEIYSFNTEIDHAVEVLDQTVNEILDSVDHTAIKANEIASGASKSYQMATKIAKYSKKSAEVAENTHHVSHKISVMVANLLEIINRFKF